MSLIKLIIHATFWILLPRHLTWIQDNLYSIYISILSTQIILFCLLLVSSQCLSLRAPTIRIQCTMLPHIQWVSFKALNLSVSLLTVLSFIYRPIWTTRAHESAVLRSGGHSWTVSETSSLQSKLHRSLKQGSSTRKIKITLYFIQNHTITYLCVCVINLYILLYRVKSLNKRKNMQI